MVQTLISESHRLGSLCTNKSSKSRQKIMQYKTSECKYLKGPGLCSPDSSLLVCFNLSTLPPQVSLLSSVTSTGCFFPSDERVSITQSYFLDSSRCSVLHCVLSAKSPRAAGLCANWGFTFTAKTQPCFNAVYLPSGADPALSFHHEEICREAKAALTSPSEDQSLCVSAGVLQHS